MSRERRKHERLPASFPARVRFIAEEETFTPFQFEATCVDISQAGVLVTIPGLSIEQYDVLFRRPRFLRVTCELPDGGGPLSLFGRVVWHEYSRNADGLCRAAVEFEPIGAKDQKRLNCYLEASRTPL